MYNKKYRSNMLQIIDNGIHVEAFHMSSPSKVSNKSKRAFSLPAGPDFSCPGATEACVDCYAQSGRHHFSNVQRAFARNWELLKRFEDANDEVGCAQELARYVPRDGLFRIHESGDFHSQFAVNAWALVVANNTDVDFYAYTRSFHLNFVPLLDNSNFLLWASTDNYNHAAASLFVSEYGEYGVKHAFGPWDHDAPIPEQSFVCPVTSGKLKNEGACEKCKLCIVPNRTTKNVVFFSH